MASKEDREYIGRYIDIEGTRLSDDDAELLIDFIAVSYTHLTLPTTPYV